MFSLTYTWETPQEAAERLGITDMDPLCSWIVEQVNRGLAEGAHIVSHTGWHVPVFRKRVVQGSLFDGQASDEIGESLCANSNGAIGIRLAFSTETTPHFAATSGSSGSQGPR